MKKKLGLVLLLLSGITSSYSQIARWEMRPVYDTMYLPEGSSIIVTTNRSDKFSSIWTMLDCKLLQRVEGDIYPFHNSVAVNTEKNGTKLKGFILHSGYYVSAPKGDFYVDTSYPFFSGGYLIVRESSKYYRYLDTNNKLFGYRYNNALPFFNGYSSCEYYGNQVEMRIPVHCLIDENLKVVNFNIQGKPVKKTDVDFVSSVNDEGVAVVIVKRRLYLFHADSTDLQPVCYTMGSNNIKEQVKLKENLNVCFAQGSSSGILKVDGGKHGTVIVLFDGFLKPTTIRWADKARDYQKKAEQKEELPSSLREVKGKGGFGIFRGQVEVLAPQFEEVPLCFGDNAIVRKNGKYGMIHVLSGKNFSVTIFDKDAAIPFIHKELKTSIKVDIPQEILADSAYIQINNQPGFEINKASREVKRSHTANWIEYNCTMTIPQELFDRDTAEMTFPIQVKYDGFLSPIMNIKETATVRKYWSVKVDNEQWFDQDSLSFDISLEYSDPLARDAKYRVFVTVQPATICSIERFNDIKYRCTVHDIKKGMNRVVVQVAEEGLPSTSFPFFFENKPEPPALEIPVEIKVNTVSTEEKDSQGGKKKNTSTPTKKKPPKKQTPNF